MVMVLFLDKKIARKKGREIAATTKTSRSRGGESCCKPMKKMSSRNGNKTDDAPCRTEDSSDGEKS